MDSKNARNIRASEEHFYEYMSLVKSFGSIYIFF
jgi:hypothetical protein